VIKAIKMYQNSLLDGHTLQLSVSKKTVEQNTNRRKKQQLEFEPKSAKLIVRNVAFEATKQDLRDLFK
jgi:multiple RNA-binding domain-containing protein 1